MTALIRPAIGPNTASTMPRQSSENQNASWCDKEEDAVDSHGISVVAFVVVSIVAFVIVVDPLHILVIVAFIVVDMSTPIPSTAEIHAAEVRTIAHLCA